MRTEDIPAPDSVTEVDPELPLGGRAGSLLRFTAPAALIVAVIAAALSVWAVASRPGESVATVETGSAPTAQQAEESSARVCAAFDLVRTAVSVQTNSDLGGDAIAREAVAANARLAILGGGGYLLSTVDPATPPDLAEAARSFARLLQGVGARQLAGAPGTDPALTAQVNEAQGASTRTAALCA